MATTEALSLTLFVASIAILAVALRLNIRARRICQSAHEVAEAARRSSEILAGLAPDRRERHLPVETERRTHLPLAI